MRVIFYAEPKSVEAAAAFKTVADEESLEGRWFTPEGLMDMIKQSKGKHKLRGYEMIEFAEYINNGGQIFPMSFISGPGGLVPNPAIDKAFVLDENCQKVYC